jgi:hypothetical protein
MMCMYNDDKCYITLHYLANNEASSAVNSAGSVLVIPSFLSLFNILGANVLIPLLSAGVSLLVSTVAALHGVYV